MTGSVFGALYQDRLCSFRMPRVNSDASLDIVLTYRWPRRPFENIGR